MSSSDALKSDHILNEPNPEATTESTSRIFPSCPEEEIVISGVAGRYPNCDNVEEFRHHLYNKVCAKCFYLSSTATGTDVCKCD